MPELPFEYIRQSLYFFRSHFMMIMRIQLPFLLLEGFFAMMISGTPSEEGVAVNQATSALLNLTLMPIYGAATIHYLNSVVYNQPLTAGQAIVKGLGRWWALLLVYLFVGFFIISGLSFFIIPGLFILARLAFADYICVLEGKGVFESIAESWRRTGDYFWILLNGLVILFVCINGPNFAIQMSLASDEGSAFLPVVTSIIFSLISVLITVYGFRIYCVHRESNQPAPPPPPAEVPEDRDQDQ